MQKTWIASVLTGFGVLGWQGIEAQGTSADHKPSLALKEEALVVKHNPTTGETVIVVEAESEMPLGRVEVRGSDGKSVFQLAAQAGEDLSLSSFVLETRESSGARLFHHYAEGIYDIHARTIDGDLAVGSAVLSHALLPQPQLLYPARGADNVPTTLRVSWVPDSEAVGYEVFLEQGDNDGLAVKLGRDAHELEIPLGVLRPRTTTHLELGVIGFNGNRTFVEVDFTTR